MSGYTGPAAPDSASPAGLPASFTHSLIAQGALEGVPIRVIARMAGQPFAQVSERLQEMLSAGEITSVPKPDWTPRVPVSPTGPIERMPADRPEEYYEFHFKRLFRLTRLEAVFLVTLLKHLRVHRMTLHVIIEERRTRRAQPPLRDKPTNVKMSDVVICKLRTKLRATDGRLQIETDWGNGYYIAVPVKRLLFEKLEKG